MREIKFRAWNTDSNEWDNQQITQVYVGLDGEVIATDGKHLWNNLKCLELTQYTGMNDKNGTEIYEGDIVSNKEFTGEVYYTNRGTWDCASYILGGYNESSEVIGNRFENSELLKEE